MNTYQQAALHDCCVPSQPAQYEELIATWQRDKEDRRAVLKAVSARRAEMQRQRDNPDMFIRSNPPPPPLPQSVALLTALGYLQDLRNGQPVEDIDELASNAGIPLWEIRSLILTAEEKGYLTWNDDDSIALTPKGWKWYENHNPL